MRVLVTGASGFIGSSLVHFLMAKGDTVTRLVRESADLPGNLTWNPDEGVLDASKLEGFDAVVHLAGESIANERWTEEKKKRILDSRVIGTRLLCQSFANLKKPPKVLVSATAIGYYGSRGEAVLTEGSGKGQGFLADVCREWEFASQIAAKQGMRVVNARIGMVLSPEGGALKQMLIPFKYGLGGKIGNGCQYMSWIAIDDVIGAFHEALMDEKLDGPVNFVSPNPVTNAEFTKILGKILNRPTFFPLPAFVARLAMGEMANELLLCSARVQPKRLEEEGYRFLYPTLEGALRHLLIQEV